MSLKTDLDLDGLLMNMFRVNNENIPKYVESRPRSIHKMVHVKMYIEDKHLEIILILFSFNKVIITGGYIDFRIE